MFVINDIVHIFKGYQKKEIKIMLITLIIIQFIFIVIVLKKAIKQMNRANYWKSECMKSEKVVKAIQGLQKEKALGNYVNYINNKEIK